MPQSLLGLEGKGTSGRMELAHLLYRTSLRNGSETCMGTNTCVPSWHFKHGLNVLNLCQNNINGHSFSQCKQGYYWRLVVEDDIDTYNTCLPSSVLINSISFLNLGCALTSQYLLINYCYYNLLGWIKAQAHSLGLLATRGLRQRRKRTLQDTTLNIVQHILYSKGGTALKLTRWWSYLSVERLSSPFGCWSIKMNSHVHFNVLLQIRVFSKLHAVSVQQRSYSRHTSDLPLSSIISPRKASSYGWFTVDHIFFWTIIAFQWKMNNTVFNPTELTGDNYYQHYISSCDSWTVVWVLCWL